jgi:hypothetical protein
MRLVQQIKEQWLGMIVGAVITAVFGFIYLQLSREARNPYFVVDPDRVEIVSAANVATAPLKVLRRDNTPITADVYAVHFYFWNAGKRSIRPADVIDTIQIVLDDSASEILDYKVVRTSRPITEISLVRGPTPRVLLLRFRILERGDGFGAQIIYQGKPGVPLRIVGNVDEAQIHLVSAPSLGRQLVNAAGAGVVFVFEVLAGLGILVIGINYVVSPLARRIWPKSLKVSRGVEIFLLVIALAGMIVVIGYFAIATTPRDATSDVPANIAR